MKTISAEELDRRFDDGEDVSDYVDWSKSTRPGLELAHADVDLPKSILRKVDAEALRLARSTANTRSCLSCIMIFRAFSSRHLAHNLRTSCTLAKTKRHSKTRGKQLLKPFWEARILHQSWRPWDTCLPRQKFPLISTWLLQTQNCRPT